MIGDDAAGHHIHPVLLDACFQSLLTTQLLDAEGAGTGGPERQTTGIRLPLSIEELHLTPVGDRTIWVHATVTRDGADELVGDMAVYADSGEPLGGINGFRAADVEKASTTVGLGTIDSWLAETVWIDGPVEPTTNEAGHGTATGAEGKPAGSSGGDWLVFADSRGVGDALSALLAARGERCHLVRPGDTYRRGGEDSEFTVDPGSASDLERLFADLNEDGRHSGGEGGAGPVGSIVHLWNLDLPRLAETSPQDLARHSGTGAYSLIALARTLLRRGTAKPTAHRDPWRPARRARRDRRAAGSARVGSGQGAQAPGADLPPRQTDRPGPPRAGRRGQPRRGPGAAA